MAANPEHSSPLRYFGVGGLIVVAAASLTLFLEERPGLNQLVNLDLDSLILSAAPKQQPDIVVVSIQDDDYRDMFLSKSPLDPAKVHELIEDIAKSGAAVIGVDLDTSEWEPALFSVSTRPHQPSIVWARAGAGEDRNAGCPLFTPDQDGVTRRYRADVGSSQHPCTMFAVAVAEQAQKVGIGRPAETHPDGKAGEEAKLINFAGGTTVFRHIRSKDLLAVASQPDWISHNVLQNKIVLLGGAFAASRDTLLTPLGPMYGVDVLAHTIASELYDTHIKEQKWLGFALDIIVGMGLVLAAWLLRRPWQIWLLIGLSFGIVFLGSWLVFRYLNIFLSFVPVVAGVLVHEVVDLRIEYGDVVRERDRLEQELTEAKRQERSSESKA